MSSTPTATFSLLLSAVGLRCLVTAAFLGCGLGAGLAYGPRWGIFVSGSGDGLMAICGDCSVAAHRRATVGPGLSQEGAAQTEIEAHARPRSNLRSCHVPPTPRREHTQVATLHPASRRGIALQSCPHFSA